MRAYENDYAQLNSPAFNGVMMTMQADDVHDEDAWIGMDWLGLAWMGMDWHALA